MRIDQDLDILWSLASANPVPSTTARTTDSATTSTHTRESLLDPDMDSTTDLSAELMMTAHENEAGPSGKNMSTATSLQHTLGALLTLAPQDRRPEILSQLLLKRTLDESLLHDQSCSYDYISYVNRVSCPVCVPNYDVQSLDSVRLECCRHGSALQTFFLYCYYCFHAPFCPLALTPL